MATNGYEMTLKYKELEQLARVEKTKWEPEGTPNLYAVARGNKSVFWIVRVSNLFVVRIFGTIRYLNAASI